MPNPRLRLPPDLEAYCRRVQAREKLSRQSAIERAMRRGIGGGDDDLDADVRALLRQIGVWMQVTKRARLAPEDEIGLPELLGALQAVIRGFENAPDEAARERAEVALGVVAEWRGEELAKNATILQRLPRKTRS